MNVQSEFIIIKRINITLILRLRGCYEEFHLPDNLLSPKYDYDFTNIKDKGKIFMRGYEYKRPCCWKRYVLKVKGKYENDNWLGYKGKSNNDNEWLFVLMELKLIILNLLLKMD